jgi:hypothetical protein
MDASVPVTYLGYALLVAPHPGRLVLTSFFFRSSEEV